MSRKSSIEILEIIFEALPTDGTVTVKQLAKRIKSTWRTADAYLDIIWRIQHGPRIMPMRAEGTRIVNWRKDYGKLPEEVIV